MTKDRLHAKLRVWDLGRLYFYSCNLERVRTHYRVRTLSLYMKPFRTYEQMLELLIERNLLASDVNEIPVLTEINGIPSISNSGRQNVINILKTYGYYNIVNLYNKPFINNDRTFSDNIDFYKLFSLHEIDAQIKLILYSPLFQSEQRLKTTIAYEFSKKYGPFDNMDMTSYIEPYLDPRNFKSFVPRDKHTEKRFQVIHQLSRVLEINHSYPPFKHYREKHHHIPIWVLVNKLTFGEVKNLYYVLNIQDSIAKEFHTTPSQLRGMINILHAIRNDCAHGSNFFHQPYPALKKHIQLFEDFSAEYGFNSARPMGNLFMILCIFKHFLSNSSYLQLCESIINTVFAMMFNTPIPTITEYMCEKLGVYTLEDAIDKSMFLVKYKLQ